MLPVRSRLLRPILTTALLLWLAFVLAAFYVVQRPITSDDGPEIADALSAWSRAPTLAALGDAALNLLVGLAITSAAITTGMLVTPRPDAVQDRSTAERAEHWILSAGLGFGLIALVVFALALTGLAQPLVISMLGSALFVAGGRRSLRALRSDLPAFRRVRLPAPLLALVVVSLTASLLMALAPPTAWDGLVYHLTVPQRAIMQGRLLPQGDIIPHENFPLLMSSLYLLGMQIRGDIAAQCIHWVFGGMCFALVALSAHRLYGRAAVPYAIALSMSMPMLLLLASWAYNDLALAFYIVAGAYAFQRWRATNTDGYFTLSAVMAGFALGLKYTAFVLPLGIAGLIAWEFRARAVRPLARFGVISSLVAAPWYLKNFIFSGNPVYPFVLGGVEWDTLRTVWYARPGTGIGLDLGTLLTLPVTITLGYRDANYIDGRIGPLLLAALPLLMLNRPRVDRYLVLGGLFFVFWVSGVIGTSSLWQARLLLPALLLIIPALAGGLCALKQFDHPHLSLHGLLRMVLALVLAVTVLTQLTGLVAMNPIAYLAGAETRESFLLRRTGAYAEAMTAVADLPAAARVQFLWEPRSYLAARAVRADSLLDALPHLTATQGSLEAGVRQLKVEGFTHILVYETGAAFAIQATPDLYSPRDRQDLQDLEQNYSRMVFDNKAYHLLELR